jgi:hypothetical protein
MLLPNVWNKLFFPQILYGFLKRTQCCCFLHAIECEKRQYGWNPPFFWQKRYADRLPVVSAWNLY